jgi:hypothetical protein
MKMSSFSFSEAREVERSGRFEYLPAPALTQLGTAFLRD